MLVYPHGFFGTASINPAFSVNAVAGANGQSIVTIPPFEPDLVWSFDRGGGLNAISTSVRGVGKYFTPPSGAESTDASALTAFNVDGATFGSSFDGLGNDYVHYSFREAPEYGIDVVTYTGAASAQNIAHSLGVTPEFIMTRNLVTAGSANCYHIGFDFDLSNPELYYLPISNTTDEALTSSAAWDNTLPDSSNFRVGTGNLTNKSGELHVALLLASKVGYTKIGRYVGSGVTLTTIVDCGFRPRFVLIRAANVTSAGWYVYDSVRDLVNPRDNAILPSGTSAETGPTGGGINLISNGFQLIESASILNESGKSYAFIAIA
mgnify:CR=1 FL=1